MSEAHAPAAWWEEVEHLREAAERRIAERERAQREGREPGSLPPLRPLRDSERDATPAASATATPRPLQAAPPPARTGRFRRLRGADRPESGPTGHAAAATATALALDLELDTGAITTLDVDETPAPWDLDTAAAALADSAATAAEPARDGPAAPARPDRARETEHAGRERPTRREELSRLAREQARAATANATVSRPRGAEPAARRTVEIRGRVEPRPVIAAVPDPVETPYRRRRPRPTAAERFVAQPDRIALWAFLLGLFLIVVALLSAH